VVVAASAGALGVEAVTVTVVGIEGGDMVVGGGEDAVDDGTEPDSVPP
jgi:hypothetical protein